MIAVFVNTTADTATFAPLFKDIESISLYNPTREELERVLTENPTETLMCLGHGSPMGLFSANTNGFLLDRENVHLLVEREMTLQDYTTEELKAELKRRSDLAKVERAKVKRCRMCIHYGEVNYYGEPISKEVFNISRCCQFFSWGKNDRYRKCHAPSQPACIYFEPIMND